MSNSNKAERVLRSTTMALTTVSTNVVWSHTVTYPARRLRIVANGNTWIKISDTSSPTAAVASDGNILIPSGAVCFFAVAGNEYIAAISATANVQVNITELTH